MSSETPLTLRSALVAALGIAADLDKECEPGGEEPCTAHDWTRTDLPCPHWRARVLLKELGERPPTGPFTDATLRALMLGRDTGQTVHAHVREGGHQHRATLMLTPAYLEGSTTLGARTSHGMLDVTAADVLDLDVVTAAPTVVAVPGPR